jgi:medium-chain acyl-[acyl-carrier-protein] hydrolase
MYSFDSRIRYSEVDQEGNITLHSILDYFQDCSSFQSEDLEVGIDFLKEHQVAWVLISWQIEVERYPKHGEPVKIGTWPYGFNGFFGNRNFVMLDEAGKRLARADSLWALMDLKKGRPVKILPEMAGAYRLEPPLPMKTASRKMELPEQMEAREPFAVHKFHLDTNQHVNNGKYILMAQEYLPQEFKIGKMRAEYKKSAVLGDTIYPSVAVQEKQIVVALSDQQGKPYVIVELEKKND